MSCITMEYDTNHNEKNKKTRRNRSILLLIWIFVSGNFQYKVSGFVFLHHNPVGRSNRQIQKTIPHDLSASFHTPLSPTLASTAGIVDDIISHSTPISVTETYGSKSKTEARKVLAQKKLTSIHEKKEKFLIHRCRSAAMIKRSPSIAGIGICKGWTQETTKAFCKAVEKLVELNPILTGKVYENTRSGRKELRIQTGFFPLESHSFVRIIEPKDTLSVDLDSSDPAKILDAANACFPLMDDSELTTTQIQKRLPLFGTTLILLPNDTAVYSLKMSHALGDGVTFFMLLKQLSLLMSDLEVTPIDWNHPQRATHELYPESLTNRDIEIMYGAPFMVGAVKNVLTQTFPRKTGVLLLDKTKVNKVRQRIRSELGCSEISANDVITSALCQADKSSDWFVFTENARGNSPGLGHNAAGNFLVEVPISKEIGSHPDKLRQAVWSSQHHQYHPEDPQHGLPLDPFVNGRVARITSLATIPATLMYKGTEQLCTIPYLSFLEKIPLDTAFIFRFNKNYWGVAHNFAEIEITGLLAELLADVDTSYDIKKENYPLE